MVTCTDVCKMFVLLKKTTTISCYSFCKLWSSLATSCVCCSKIQLNLQNVSKDVQKVVSLKVKTSDFSFSFSDTWTNDYLVSTLQLINEKQNWSKWVDSVRAIYDTRYPIYDCCGWRSCPKHSLWRALKNHTLWVWSSLPLLQATIGNQPTS